MSPTVQCLYTKWLTRYAAAHASVLEKINASCMLRCGSLGGYLLSERLNVMLQSCMAWWHTNLILYIPYYSLQLFTTRPALGHILSISYSSDKRSPGYAFEVCLQQNTPILYSTKRYIIFKNIIMYISIAVSGTFTIRDNEIWYCFQRVSFYVSTNQTNKKTYSKTNTSPFALTSEWPVKKILMFYNNM